MRFLGYHHWNDADISKGIWVCQTCHQAIEWYEKGLFALYILKKAEIME
jgi:hypothetical protein